MAAKSVTGVGQGGVDDPTIHELQHKIEVNYDLPLTVDKGGTGAENKTDALSALLPDGVTIDDINYLTGTRDNLQDQIDESGLKVKDSVRAATISNITLSGEQTIDTVVLLAGDRVLVKDQTAAKDNGIYVVSASAWSRASDSDTINEVQNTIVFVEEGNVNISSTWALSTHPETFNDPQTFSQFTKSESVTAGTGMTRSGSTLNVNGTSNRITANANNIDIASNYVGQTSLTTLGTVTTNLGTPWSTVEIINNNYSVPVQDKGEFLDVDASGGNITISLPDAVTAGNGFLISI
jgi:phage-related tail fiber protein